MRRLPTRQRITARFFAGLVDEIAKVMKDQFGAAHRGDLLENLRELLLDDASDCADAPVPSPAAGATSESVFEIAV